MTTPWTGWRTFNQLTNQTKLVAKQCNLADVKATENTGWPGGTIQQF